MDETYVGSLPSVKKLFPPSRKPNVRVDISPTLKKFERRKGPSTSSEVAFLGNKADDCSKFETYWIEDTVTAGLGSGQLLSGQLRINARNYTEAFVRHPKGDADIYIPGTRARNRALNGDIVVIRLEPLRNWRIYDAFARPPNPGVDMLTDAVSTVSVQSSNKSKYTTVDDLLRRDQATFSKLFQNIEGNIVEKFDDLTDPEEVSLVSSDQKLPWWQIIQRTGRVVCIRKRLNCRACVGFLRPLVPKNESRSQNRRKSEQIGQDWSLAILSPTDSRVPRIVIPKQDCPADFIRQPDTFKLVRFVARITDWPEDSIFAKGELLRHFGNDSMSCIETETDTILVSTGFPLGLSEVNTFPGNVDAYVQQKLASFEKDLAHQFEIRRDFRSQCVFTIDPRTARDLDDALHIRTLGNSEIDYFDKKGAHNAKYEVGVHIADVTHYVRPDDPIDVEASIRATTIYLVQLCVPMLPRALCEDLCSLHPGTDKLAFSVVFILTSEAVILSKWFGRTVIHSRAKLSYEDAQSFLDEPTRDWKNSDFPTLEESASVKEICESVLLLNELADKMRSRRFTGGSVQLNQVKCTFSLSSETGLPIGVSPFILKPANRLIEEWMLTANEAVATLLAKRLPATAFLRRHPPPTVKQLKEAQTVLSAIGVQVDVGTAGDLQNSLSRLSGKPIDEGWQHSDELAELCASMMSRLETGSDSNQFRMLDTLSSTNSSLSDDARMLTTLNLLTKCMNLAEYFCLGAADDCGLQSHYALNMENYTHFTSPIRRYADVIVHRQLASILAENAKQVKNLPVAEAYLATCDSPTLQNASELSSIAQYCNARKQDGRRAGEESAELFFTLFVKECGPLQEACSVVGVLTHSFDVLLLSTGLVKRVYMNKLDLKDFEYEPADESLKAISGTGIIHLQWNVRRRDLETTDNNQTFDQTNVEIITNVENSVSICPLPADPAIIHATPTKSVRSKTNAVGRHSKIESVGDEIPAPCKCFVSHIRLFDICRCLIATEASTTCNAGENEEVIKTNTMPQLRVTMMRPTCELCESYC